MKLTGNMLLLLKMTSLDSGGQRSRSQPAIEVAKTSTLMLRCCSPSSSSSCSLELWSMTLICELDLIGSRSTIPRSEVIVFESGLTAVVDH